MLSARWLCLYIFGISYNWCICIHPEFKYVAFKCKRYLCSRRGQPLLKIILYLTHSSGVILPWDLCVDLQCFSFLPLPHTFLEAMHFFSVWRAYRGLDVLVTWALAIVRAKSKQEHSVPVRIFQTYSKGKWCRRKHTCCWNTGLSLCHNCPALNTCMQSEGVFLGWLKAVFPLQDKYIGNKKIQNQARDALQYFFYLRSTKFPSYQIGY